MVYRSKKVWWSVLLFVAPSLAGMIGGVAGIAAIFTNPVPGSVRGLLAVALVVTIALSAILLWSFLSASYEITPEELVVRFGPIRLRYRLSTIIEAIPARGPIIRVSLSFATSWDLVYIKFRPGGLPLTISPANKTEFLRELAERVPGLRGRGEGAQEDSTRRER
jgi:hypothetical protein